MPISTYYKRPSKEDGEDNIGHCGCDPDNLAARLHTLATTRIMRSQRKGNEHLEQWYVEQTVDDANADDQLPLRHKHQPWERLPQKQAPSARSNRPESSMKTHDKHCAVFLIKCPLANSVRLWGFIKNVNENLWVTKIVDSITVLQSQNSQTVKRKIRGLCCFFFLPGLPGFKTWFVFVFPLEIFFSRTSCFVACNGRLYGQVGVAGHLVLGHLAPNIRIGTRKLEDIKPVPRFLDHYSQRLALLWERLLHPKIYFKPGRSNLRQRLMLPYREAFGWSFRNRRSWEEHTSPRKAQCSNRYHSPAIRNR